MYYYLDFFVLIAIFIVIFLLIHFSKKSKLDRKINKVADIINKYGGVRTRGNIWVKFFETLLERYPLEGRNIVADNVAKKIAEIIKKETGEHCINFFALGINENAPETFWPLFAHPLCSSFIDICRPILNESSDGGQAIDWMYEKYLEKESIQS